MNLEGFGPYILPFAEECPDAVWQHHAKLAAIEFFRKTNVWTGPLQAMDGDGTTIGFPMVTPAGAVVTRLLAVILRNPGQAPFPVTLMDEADASHQVDIGSAMPMAWSGADRGLLFVHPAPVAGATVTATAALKPSQAADSIPDAQFEHYAADIADGALATLLAMPGVPWANERAAMDKAAAFKARTTITPLAARGKFARAVRTSATRWF